MLLTPSNLVLKVIDSCRSLVVAPWAVTADSTRFLQPHLSIFHRLRPGLFGHAERVYEGCGWTIARTASSRFASHRRLGNLCISIYHGC